MKINLTLEVSDDLRRLIGQGQGVVKTKEGLATHAWCHSFLVKRLAQWEVIAEGFSVPADITPQEKTDLMDAIAYLSAQGSDATYIKRWIFKQRARRDFLNARLS
jgi:hypothetical protein